MTYQDIWLRGRTIADGQRECADRYDAVRVFCREHFGDRPFSVCDIGANYCYFGLRLTEDFPACTVIAFEYHQFARKAAHVRVAGNDRLRLFQRKVTLPDLHALASCCHFDLVLALSVLHHMPGAEEDWIAALRGIGCNVILERAVSDSRARAKSKPVETVDGAVTIGQGKSHIVRGETRPIVMLSGRQKA